MVTSDDDAYSWQAKLLGKDRFDKCPNGIPGIEPRLSILYSEGVAKGRISLSKFVELIAAAPANLFGLAPAKGSLNHGSDADIVIFNPDTKWIMNQDTLHMAADWSAYEDIKITGPVRTSGTKLAVVGVTAEDTDITETVSAIVLSYIENAFVDTHLYQVLERRNLDAILEEQEFMLSGLV